MFFKSQKDPVIAVDLRIDITVGSCRLNGGHILDADIIHAVDIQFKEEQIADILQGFQVIPYFHRKTAFLGIEGTGGHGKVLRHQHPGDHFLGHIGFDIRRFFGRSRGGGKFGALAVHLSHPRIQLRFSVAQLLIQLFPAFVHFRLLTVEKRHLTVDFRERPFGGGKLFFDFRQGALFFRDFPFDGGKLRSQIRRRFFSFIGILLDLLFQRTFFLFQTVDLRFQRGFLPIQTGNRRFQFLFRTVQRFFSRVDLRLRGIELRFAFGFGAVQRSVSRLNLRTGRAQHGFGFADIAVDGGGNDLVDLIDPLLIDRHIDAVFRHAHGRDRSHPFNTFQTGQNRFIDKGRAFFGAHAFHIHGSHHDRHHIGIDLHDHGRTDVFVIPKRFYQIDFFPHFIGGGVHIGPLIEFHNDHGGIFR